MPQVSILFGLVLCALTVFGMMGTPEKLATAFVPMMLGIPLVFCGIVSLNPHRRKSWMRVAGLVGLIGFVSSGGRLGYQITSLLQGEWVNRFSIGLLWGIAGLCLLFLACMIFDHLRVRCRRKRKQLSDPQSALRQAAQSTPNSDDNASLRLATAPPCDPLAPSEAEIRSVNGTLAGNGERVTSTAS